MVLGVHKLTFKQKMYTEMENIHHPCYPPQEQLTNKKQGVTRNPREMSRKLKASLAVANKNAHESTIRRSLNNNHVQGGVAQIVV